MGFEVDANAYAAFMGRNADLLAPQFADLLGLGPGQRVLDVGCGPGALTAILVERLGADRVAAVDPSARDEAERPGARDRDLRRLFEAAGLHADWVA